MVNLACLVWIVIGIIFLFRLREWGKMMDEMYEEIMNQIEEEEGNE